MNRITEGKIQDFQEYLRLNEKSPATVEKYVRTVRELADFMGDRKIDKSLLLEYRERMREGRKAQTVNGMLSAINSYLDFCGMSWLKVRFLKVQTTVFLEEDRELTETEYRRLLEAARAEGNERLYLLMMTLGGTGIRVGELRFITVENVRRGRTEISMKGKIRTIILQKELCRRLLAYAEGQRIRSGCIFRTRSGNPLDRSNVCHEMKKLCGSARVLARKVFPHNLRHLFARTFYRIEKNLSHLADVLGHSRIETTRRYVAVSAGAHERILKRMNLVI